MVQVCCGTSQERIQDTLNISFTVPSHLMSHFCFFLIIFQICLMISLKAGSVWIVEQCLHLCGGEMGLVITCVMHVDFTTRWTASTGHWSNLKDDSWVKSSLLRHLFKFERKMNFECTILTEWLMLLYIVLQDENTNMKCHIKNHKA